MSNSEYLDVFIEESQEHLQTVNDSLLQLEKEPDDLSLVNEVFRSAHTLKGMAATMGFEDLAHLTHTMENVLDLIRNEELEASSEILDVVFDSVDDLEEMINDIAEGGSGKRDIQQIADQLEAIQRGEAPSAAGSAEVAAANAQTEVGGGAQNLGESYDEFELTVITQSKEQGFSPYQIRITLDENTMLKAARVYMVFEILEEAGEVIKSTPPVDELEEENFDHEFIVTLVTKESKEDLNERINRISEIQNIEIILIDPEELGENSEAESEPKTEAQGQSSKDSAKAESPESSQPVQQLEPQQQKKDDKDETTKKPSEANKTIRVSIERLDVLMNLFEELVIDRGRLEQISSELDNNELSETVERMSRISGDLQEIILNMRMMPVDQVFNRFPRMVRSLSKDLGKKVNLDIYGAETELDRTIIDEIGDPLVHLIRNSIDHGIETPAERLDKGKSEEGTLVLRAYHSGNNVFIEIEDDGAGINQQKVINKALSNGVVTQEEIEKMSDEQIFGLLFESGLSTADQVTDVSGRGVGLDVVKNTFESLGGVVTVNSEQNVGSIFSIQLPLTLSIIDVMLVELQKEKYAIPLSSIVETAIVNKEDVYSAHNQKVIDFRGNVVPLVFLKNVFEVPEAGIEDEYYSVVLVSKGEKMAGLVVDSLVGQHDVVLKSLGSYLTNVFAISGATILGDGQVALIVDTNALIK
ncbi:two-component system chemotaxis sensor kinase CheA [Salsuginibacillus halophilus]|uniref:Chemotaxis protein CheA n=1 Tax=Salsuginibacillus halophilus TaxID=517424 RepID=A0A2P8HCJ4_9BACI|nr:chemotaxis protein CheA [Salsuginibacillus halophilus]PSL43950.1 two-component system chemotaxis sensor kinase CheA [Salsuginibacillus halophilus]